MTNIALPILKTTISPEKLLQGCVSYAVAIMVVFAVVFGVAGLTQSILSSNDVLRAQSQALSTISAALTQDRNSLAANLQAIGLNASYDAESLSSARAIEQLSHDAERLIATMQGFGFQLEGNAPPSEAPISTKLSAYNATLTFTGDTGAIAAFLQNAFENDMRIATLTISGASSLQTGQTAYTLNISLTGVGAASSAPADIAGARAGE